MTVLRRALLVAALVAIAGCAATPSRDAPSRDDPFEPMNRVSYRVHEVVDGQIVKPVIQAYVDYTPRLVRQGISNFFNNIDDMFSIINDFLQWKLDKAGNDMGRVMINTGPGLLGLIDIASDAGIPRGNEDFGQTFGYWGFPQGPYIFIPVFGPTTVRDGTGWIIRGYANPVGYIDDIATRNILWTLNLVDLRASALQTESLVNQAAIDPYTFIRRAYLQRRQFLVYDGQPPPTKEEEE